MHQDYVLRMIQQMTTFITRVLGLRKEGDDEGAIAEITQAYGQLAGLPASLVHGLSEEDLITLLTVENRASPDRTVALAALLKEEAEIYLERGDWNEAYPRYLKALRLYLETLRNSDDLSAEEIPGLDETIERLDGYPVAPKTRGLLLAYLEASGKFDLAENRLVDWIETDETGAAKASAMDFYRRLLEMGDAELIVGGLTRDEVKEGIRNLPGDGETKLSD
jgi:tetratricopeptide (TPR) repeat protein